MSVAHRWGRITKYTSITCLTLAILSTLVLNIISSYSNSSTRSKAEPVSNSSISTLADTELDPTGISISISSYSSSSTGGNNPNLSLLIPQGGGIATGRHTITVETGSSVIGYELQLSSNGDETGLVKSDNVDNEENDSGSIISTTTGTIASPSQLADKSYGYTLANLDNDSSLANTNVWAGLKPSTSPDTIATVDEASLAIGQTNATRHNIYYGVNIQNPVETRAGDYTRQVVYTVVGELMPEPTVEDLVLNSSWTDTTPDTAYGSTSILTGQNLSGVTGVYIDLNDNETKDSGEEVTNLAHGTGDEASTKLTFTAPTYTQEGQKNVYLEWPGGDPVKIENGWSYVGSSRCNSNSGMSSCRVDIDDNMIPVAYTGDDTNAEWTALIPCTYGFGLGSPASCYGSLEWFDYSNGQWANAVTLRDDYNSGCYVRQASNSSRYSHLKDSSQCNSATNALTPLDFTKAILGQMDDFNLGTGEVYVDDERISGGWVIPQSDILGYWVYIPRYSYEVMRRDAIDLVQQPEDFKIKFETADTTKKVPVEGCSDTNNPKSYRVGCSLNRTYTNTATDTSTNEVTNTTWATHPAFTWMDEDGSPVELNGIWVGKFETTGSTEQPTVLPNEKHMNLTSGNIGDTYDVAKSMGIEDKNNKYGNTAETNLPNQNNNNLVSSPSHMLKNSEWGAVAYLSASRYGAGVNKVQLNGNYASGSDDNGDSSYGVTGCGPQANGDENDYDTSGTLGTSTACGSADKAYNGTLGQYASTTNNVYGVYDMGGGAHERVMGSYATDNSSQSSTSHFTNATKPPYVDLYNITSNNDCTWNTNGSACGGHALFETASWGGDRSYFVFSFVPWFLRGGYADDGSAGVFASSNTNGYSGDGFRVALIAN